MFQHTSAGGIVSEDELTQLTDLFRQFEGAANPLSNHCQECESRFNALVEKIYEEKVKPAFSTLTFSSFRSYTRNRCRVRLSKEGPPYPCP